MTQAVNERIRRKAALQRWSAPCTKSTVNGFLFDHAAKAPSE